MFALLFLTIYTLIYYFIVYKKTKHLDLSTETINMFKTDFPTSFYISVFYTLLLISLTYYIFYTDYLQIFYLDIFGGLLIIFSGVIEYQGIIALKDNYFPQTGKEQNLITEGIFSYIRHPIYLSGILLAAGIFILFSKNIFFYLIIPTILVIVYKVESEERYLLKRFTKYNLYKKKSYKLIPFLY